MPLELGYWEIRGLAAALRMLLEYTGADYTDTRFSRDAEEEWFERRKPELLKKNALVTLPFVVDGDTVVTQSNACLTYLGRKFGLAGSTPAEVTKHEQVLAEVFDLRNGVVRTCYPSDFSPTAENFPENLKRHWGCAERAYGKLEGWFAQEGKAFSCTDNKPLAADFHLLEMLDQHELMRGVIGAPSLLEGHPRLAAFYAKMKALPQLQKYFEGAGKLPCNNRAAHFR